MRAVLADVDQSAREGPTEASMTTHRQRSRLDRLYATLPQLACQGLCAESCGPIGMSAAELDRISERIGQHPVATSIDCPLLEADRCTVYAIRPMICRLWGLVETMPCPHGCTPSRWLAHAEGFEFLRRAAAIGGPDALLILDAEDLR